MCEELCQNLNCTLTTILILTGLLTIFVVFILIINFDKHIHDTIHDTKHNVVDKGYSPNKGFELIIDTLYILASIKETYNITSLTSE